MSINSKLFIFIFVIILYDVHGAEVIKMGTLVPKSSPWGQILSTWELAVKEKSGGQLELQFFYNGKQGSEAAAVNKMKSGRLDGAFTTAVGLSRIYKPILALQLPGLFKTWDKIDTARQQMSSDFEKGLNDAGFSLIGWSDFGAVHQFSKGFTVRTPNDVKSKKPFIDRDDSTAPVLYQLIGGVTPVLLNVPEVLPTLITGGINIVNTPSLVAEQLQGSTYLNTINKNVDGFVMGSLVLSTRRLNALSADLRKIIMDTGKVGIDALAKRIRVEDDTSFARIQGKMTSVTLSADELAQWNAVYKRFRDYLVPDTFSLNLITRLEQIANSQ